MVEAGETGDAAGPRPAAEELVAQALQPGVGVLLRFVDELWGRQLMRAEVVGWSEDQEELELRPTAVAASGLLPQAGQWVQLRVAGDPQGARLEAMARVRRLGPDGSPLVVGRPARPVQERRGMYRVDVDLAAEIAACGPARVLNLSGSGCLLKWPASCPAPVEGQGIALRLQLPGRGQPLELQGLVVRTVEHAGGWRAGVHFQDLRRPQEDALVRYVFHRQAELLRRGVLDPQWERPFSR